MASSKKQRQSPDRLPEAFLAALARGSSDSSLPATIAVAYSGGLDSSVLLHAAAHALKQAQSRIVAIHIHHGLSEHADDWVRHCETQCQALGIPLVVERVTVTRRGGESLEAEARTARYDAMERIALLHQCTVLVTAHHASDQAETVLINLARGTGVAGIGAMAPDRNHGALRLVRPFLEFQKSDLVAYAEFHGLGFIEDPSNTDTRHARNSMRHDVIPALLESFPQAVLQISRFAGHARHAQTLLEDLGRIDLSAAAATHDGFSLATLRELSALRATNALRTWFRERGSEVPSTSALEEILQQLLNSDSARRVIACGEESLRVFRDRAFIHRPLKGTHARLDSIDFQWRGESVLSVPSWDGMLTFTESAAAGVAREWLAHAPLTLRGRLGGERLQLSLDRPSRTLKNLYQENAIPPWQRPRLPLLYSDERMVMAAGLGMDVRVMESSMWDGPRIAIDWVGDTP